jgi:hypothetical protein
MGLWTPDEFQRVAVTTRINARTLDACRDVLVHGATTNAASAAHKMFASQVSRALTTLREKHEASLEVATVRDKAAEMQEYLATEVGRAMFGRSFQSSRAEPGRVYEGPVVAQTDAFLIQKVGLHGVLHDLAKMTTLPALNADVAISYPEADGMALCEPIQRRAEKKGAEIGR